LLIALLVLVFPYFFYRWEYTHSKRLRVVVPGRVYRSGQMTASGFAEAVEGLHLRTIINFQDDYPDPDIDEDYFGGKTIKESELGKQLGVRYIFIAPDVIPRRWASEFRPEAIDKALAILDDPATYPVLFHCHAGLHRTGVITAIYRMEYQGWSREAAYRELRENGFGAWPGTSANEYISQYVLTYQPGIRNRPEQRLTGRFGPLPELKQAEVERH
jgi:protein tyrosine/serine phosphatase